ncbi:hypothetical protein [Microbispora sp. NPDC046933]|uniref:hypothetical protein n=1 Tax=Microbispora sp. NPDC046933 TaxID=3155618 RepID=UPI0033D32FE9
MFQEICRSPTAHPPVEVGVGLGVATSDVGAVLDGLGVDGIRTTPFAPTQAVMTPVSIDPATATPVAPTTIPASTPAPSAPILRRIMIPSSDTVWTSAEEHCSYS